MIYTLAKRRGWGLDRIAEHLSYSRSQVATVLQRARQNGALQ